MKRIEIIWSVAALSIFSQANMASAEAFRVKATREGLVGGITATGHRIQENDWFVALPSRKALKKKVYVCHQDTCLIAEVKDVGPWNSSDPYWISNMRPQAESGIDKFGRRTSRSGIDLSDGVAYALNCGDMCNVTWEFID